VGGRREVAEEGQHEGDGACNLGKIRDGVARAPGEPKSGGALACWKAVAVGAASPSVVAAAECTSISPISIDRQMPGALDQPEAITSYSYRF
jgi:hypothetical protein